MHGRAAMTLVTIPIVVISHVQRVLCLRQVQSFRDPERARRGFRVS
jgi:hypothetical protein